MNERKSNLLGKLESILQQRVVIVIKVSSLACHEIFSFREKLWDLGGNINVVKNSLARIAISNSGVSFLSEYLAGSVAFAHCNQNVPEFLRCVFKFSTDYGQERFAVLGGKYDTTSFTLPLMKDFSALPDESCIYAALVNAINSVPAALVDALNGPANLLVRYFDSYVKGGTVSTAD
ncbi:ribosomal L10 family protein [Neorickettsia helminthoeca str. Oregon]|uniref:Large ribosomal subunit protein uL10 n=1 Tax=Neorickettsia helminthoeca str. Oregon TaxID=1286528 RepID=X5H4H4_9RICK|nr:50S ribosomal protein L10 [Neorickettsia helminthoeca]AHX11578.1 ribosomal L10 family protein [Neorickettsia helminthoeca str. Oregon]